MPGFRHVTVAAVAAAVMALAVATNADAAPCSDERYPCPAKPPAPEQAVAEPTASAPLPLTQARRPERTTARKPARAAKTVPLPPEKRGPAAVAAAMARAAGQASFPTARSNTIGAAADEVAVVTPDAVNEIDLAADTVQVVSAGELSILDAALASMAASVRAGTVGASAREADGERREEMARAPMASESEPATFALPRALLLFGGIFAAASAASIMLLFR